MKRAFVFCRRNVKEMLKDPLGYVFALCFPAVMLILFALINGFVQSSAETDGGTVVSTPMPLFEMQNNAPAVALFGLSFIMLNLTIHVSKDKSTAFLGRLFSSPLRVSDYIIGYMLPGLILCFCQQLACYTCAEIVGAIEGANADGGANVFNFGIALLSVLSQIPSMFLFVSMGILFGTALGEKSAPPVVSVMINVAGLMGGCYMPLEYMGGFATFCKCLPFYPQLLASQAIMKWQAVGFGNFWGFLLIVIGYMSVIVVLTVFAFSRKMKNLMK